MYIYLSHFHYIIAIPKSHADNHQSPRLDFFLQFFPLCSRASYPLVGIRATTESKTLPSCAIAQGHLPQQIIHLPGGLVALVRREFREHAGREVIKVHVVGVGDVGAGGVSMVVVGG